MTTPPTWPPADLWAATGRSEIANRTFDDLGRWIGRTAELWENSRAFEGHGDGSHDDTSKLAAMFNHTPVGSGTVPQSNYIPKGAYRITDTITISGQSPIVRGAGIGNAADYSVPGAGTTIFWDGPAGQPMFVIEDSRHVVFQDLHIEGNPNNPPSEIVYFNGTPSAHGSNELFDFNRVRFGVGFNSSRTTDGIVCADYAVRMGGTNHNNDQFHFENCVFHGTEVGVYLPNSQSVWGMFTNCLFDRHPTAALKTSANTLLVNPSFNDCGIDIQVDSSAQVDVEGWYSEGTALMAQITGNSGALRVRGGFVLVPAGYAGANLIEWLSAGGLGSLVLDHVTIDDAQVGFVMPKIYVRGNNSTDPAWLTVRDCPYLELGDFDVAGDSNPVTGGIVCKIDVEEHEIRQWLQQNDVLSTTKAPTMFTGPLVPRRDELTTSATNGDLHVPTVAGAPTGVPDTYDGVTPFRIDRVNHQLAIWLGDWATVNLTLPTTAPGSITGLLAWYDFTDAATIWKDAARTMVAGNGDVILGVTDKSGNGYHLAEAANGPTFVTAARNGKSVGRFDGVNDHLSDTTFPSSALPLTLFAIGNANNTATTKGIVDGVTSRVSMAVLANGRVQAWAGGSVRTPNTVSVEGGWHEYHTSISDAASSVFVGVDGTEVADNSSGAGPLAGLRIGCDSTVGGAFFDGDLAHVIIVAGAMTARDRLRVARWLGTELNVAIA